MLDHCKISEVFLIYSKLPKHFAVISILQTNGKQVSAYGTLH